MKRKQTRQVHVGALPLGGGAPILVQSMTNVDTRDVEGTLEQIHALAQAGCDIVRIAVFDKVAAQGVRALVDQSPVPLVADIHFDYRLAIASLESGIHKLRINPGNIGGRENVKKLADCLKMHPVPVRVGINSGSLEADILKREGGPTPRGMVDSALGHVRMLEDFGYDKVVVSLKTSDVQSTIESYRLFSEVSDIPLHLGVTEAGTARLGIYKSAIGIGSLLADGIGDTLRVSLTGDPVPEVEAGRNILQALGLGKVGLTIISCPTCGRTRMPLEEIVHQVETRVGELPAPVTAAVMGCVVNGPGEARHADCGIACGSDGAALFCGHDVRRVSQDEMVDELVKEIHRIAREKSAGQA